MTYNKPEVVKVANAVCVIQGSPKPNVNIDSSEDPQGDRNHVTAGAYESDE
jgi:hypothetical protein